jgi:ABC-type sugar transport system ATPase subunit
MSDRIVIVNQGEVQQLAGPEEIYQRLANRCVAGFVGTPAMNVLRGRIDGGVLTGREHIILFQAGDAEFTARVPAERRVKAVGAVALAVRGRNAHLLDAVSDQRPA